MSDTAVPTRIRLPQRFSDCPLYWQNFMKIHHSNPNGSADALKAFNGEFDIRERRERYRKSNGRYAYYHTRTYELVFETESDAVAFALKWS